MRFIDVQVFSFRKAVLITCALSTWVIAPGLMFEPINISKMVVLVVGVLFCLPLAYEIYLKEQSVVIPKWITWSTLSFFTLYFISLIVSQAPMSQSFWGVFGRNTGIVTIYCLFLLLLFGFVLAKLNQSEYVLRFFVLTSIPSSFYGLLQVVGKDPILWLQAGVFSTLGNTNFASTYFALVSIASAGLLWINKSNPMRLVYAAFIFINTLLAIATDSIQGPIMILVALALLSIFIVANRFSLLVSYVYLFAFIAIGSYSVFSLFGFGPVGTQIKQETLSLRSDYWRAALRMISDSPLLGKGPDAYGDYYRRERDLEAILKTSAGRVTNTAHNIFLDIGVSAGLFAALILLFLFSLPILYLLKKMMRRDISIIEFIYLLLSTTFFLQTLISINQISIAVWGWLFAGVILGLMGKSKSSPLQQKFETRKKRNSNFENSQSMNILLPADSLIKCLLSATLGFLIVFYPARTDIDFQENFSNKNIDGLIKASRALGSTVVHMETTLDSMQSLAPQVRSIFAEEIVRKYPSSVYSWKTIHDLNPPNSSLRLQAVDKFVELDPLNPETWVMKWMSSPPASLARKNAVEKLKILDPNETQAFVRWKKLESLLDCTDCQVYPGP